MQQNIDLVNNLKYLAYKNQNQRTNAFYAKDESLNLTINFITRKAFWMKHGAFFTQHLSSLLIIF